MLNHIVIMGRLTRDPELRTTQSGISVTSYTVAVDRDFGGRDGGERQTDFIDCVAWRQTGEFVSKYFHKGSMIVVSGRLQSRKWQDRDGNNRTSWEIIADNVYFGESRRDSEASSGGYNSYDNRSTGYDRAPGYDNRGGGYDAGRSSAPSPAPARSAFQELEDEGDGELPF
jgi:single-strand DNA-binding protein